MNAKDALKRSELFRSLDEREIDEVAALISEREVEPGQVLIREGEDAYSLFILEEGSVDILRNGAEGQSSRITELSEGAMFGEMSFIPTEEAHPEIHARRSAGVVAHRHGKILELRYEALERLAIEDPVLGTKLYRTLALSLNRKLKNTTDHLLPLIASARMAALGQMTADIVHELNNPLSVLRALSDRTVERLREPAPDLAELGSWASKMSATVNRVSRVISGLKAVSRDGGGDPAEEIDIPRGVHETMEFCEQRLHQAGIRFETRYPDPCPKALCRPVQLSQTLLNLLNNSVDAICESPGERSGRWIRVEVEAENQSVRIAVCDSGPGIPSESADKIFRPFFTTKGMGQGTGLGLSISRQVIAANGGSLELDRSAPHTRMVITLPKSQA